MNYIINGRYVISNVTIDNISGDYRLMKCMSSMLKNTINNTWSDVDYVNMNIPLQKIKTVRKI